MCRFAWGGGREKRTGWSTWRMWPDASAAASVPRAIGIPSGREEGTTAQRATYCGRMLGTEVTRSFLRAPLNWTSLSMNESTRWESA